MGVVYAQARPRENQPEFRVALDPWNPITRGIVCCVVPYLPEFVFGTGYVLDDAFSMGPGGHPGNAWRSPTTQTQGYVQYDIPDTSLGATDLTWGVLCWPKGDASGPIGTHLLDVSTASSTSLSLGSANYNVQLDGNSSGTVTVTSSDRPHWFAGVRRGSTVEAWRDGVMGASGVTGTRAWVINSLIIGRNTVNNNIENIWTYLMVVWNRALTSLEQLTMTINPWQIFEPSGVPIHFPDAGGAATTWPGYVQSRGGWW